VQLIWINFAAPVLVLLIMLFVAIRFSGSPLRSAVYSQKLKLLHIAVIIWSVARFLRATGGLYESQLFYGMLPGLTRETMSGKTSG
jgi:hypothetical protein